MIAHRSPSRFPPMFIRICVIVARFRCVFMRMFSVFFLVARQTPEDSSGQTTTSCRALDRSQGNLRGREGRPSRPRPTTTLTLMYLTKTEFVSVCFACSSVEPLNTDSGCGFTEEERGKLHNQRRTHQQKQTTMMIVRKAHGTSDLRRIRISWTIKDRACACIVFYDVSLYRCVFLEEFGVTRL